MKTPKHLETKNYIFYCDLEEYDEIAKMYDKEMNLISDNYFAHEFLWEILAGKTDEEIIFISDEMEYNRQEILKEIKEEDNAPEFNQAF